MQAAPNQLEGISAVQCLHQATATLADAKRDTSALDARILLLHVLGLTVEEWVANPNILLAAEQFAAYTNLIQRRAAGEPVAYLTGTREFWGLDFMVTADTLDPRPDTETLIEATLENISDKSAPLELLDLGTGTGCILLALLHELPQASGIGIEKSPKAVDVAKQNAQNLGLQSRCKFLRADWTDFSPENKFDMVVSNPPYIRCGDTTMLAPEVAEFEPDLALYGGDDGLECYRSILSVLPNLLKGDGVAIFEIGMGQKEQLTHLAKKYGFTVEAIKNDMQGIPRCMILKPSKKD